MLVASASIFLLLLSGVLSSDRRPGHRPTSLPCQVGENGCCTGWKRDTFGSCTKAVCEPECANGQCIQPNRCYCLEGYTGTTCELDHDECGALPCQHRCTNTHGSYQCHCNPGYMLSEDGTTCTKPAK